MMENPEYMRQIVTSNPEMKEMLDVSICQTQVVIPLIICIALHLNVFSLLLFQKNPELSRMLNNPEVLRNTMEMARNPSMLQDLIRTVSNFYFINRKIAKYQFLFLFLKSIQ